MESKAHDPGDTRAETDTMRIVFLDAGTLNRQELDLTPLSDSGGEVIYHEETTPDQLQAHTAGAQCVITNKVVLNSDFFQHNPQLKLVCIFATGTDNVDLQAAKEHGVTVTNCRGYSTDSVAQHAMMLILMLLRSASQYTRAVQNGDWSRSPHFCLLDYPIAETTGLTLGILGYGDIGRKLEQLAKAFGMTVLAGERPGRPAREGRVSFEQLLETADGISLHCPLTDDTRGMIGTKELAQMKPGAILINTARGELVDAEALVAALKAGEIAGAAVDVLNQEPPEAGHPVVSADLPNLLVTPHVAWASRTARQEAVRQTAESIQRWRQEQPAFNK